MESCPSLLVIHFPLDSSTSNGLVTPHHQCFLLPHWEKINSGSHKYLAKGGSQDQSEHGGEDSPMMQEWYQLGRMGTTSSDQHLGPEAPTFSF